MAGERKKYILKLYEVIFLPLLSNGEIISSVIFCSNLASDWKLGERRLPTRFQAEQETDKKWWEKGRNIF